MTDYKDASDEAFSKFVESQGFNAEEYEILTVWLEGINKGMSIGIKHHVKPEKMIKLFKCLIMIYHSGYKSAKGWHG